MYKILCYAKDPSHLPVARVNNTAQFLCGLKADSGCHMALMPRLS